MEYWHKNFRCPWYYHNGCQQIGCMVGNLKFPDKISAVEVMDNYCVNDWEKCAIAIALNNWEERKRILTLSHYLNKWNDKVNRLRDRDNKLNRALDEINKRIIKINKN